MRRVCILGSTGSIGTQTLDIVDRLGDRVRVVGLCANANAGLLRQQAERYDVHHLCLADEDAASRLREQCETGDRVHGGVSGMCRLVEECGADLVVVAVAGAVGIAPTHTALELGLPIALASKEVLVAAGAHTMRLARERGVSIVPIDSEHSALFQCLQGAPDGSVERLILTASGGPFRRLSAAEMRDITPEQALRHPTWSMGGLVTINSATLMNKGLEVIEAHWLFGVPVDRVDVLVHPQSIVHSLVQFRDGSVLGQLGLPDMRLPIQYALMYPDRIDTGLPRLDLARAGALQFEPVDHDRFPAVAVARSAAQAGGTMAAVMNAANEVAVGAFLEGRVGYSAIIEVVCAVMSRHQTIDSTYDNVIWADDWARREARSVITE